MTTAPGQIHNPSPTFPFCPDQTDFLCFRTDFGFGCVYLDLVEGVIANDSNGSNVCLTNGSVYASLDPVPDLVARFAAVKKLRYSLERQEREGTGQSRAAEPPKSSGVIWKSKT